MVKFTKGQEVEVRTLLHDPDRLLWRRASILKLHGRFPEEAFVRFSSGEYGMFNLQDIRPPELNEVPWS